MLKYILTEESTLQVSDDKLEGLLNEDLHKIISALEDNFFQVRIVGGAVRDILLGEKPRDIDLITNAKPAEVIFILADLDMNIDVFGIKHGTVKSVIGRTKYEITSLDYKINRDQQGKLQIHDGGNWVGDAQARDFSINSMSMTLNGTIFDYCNGLEDLKNEIINPLPEFSDKIKADPVLILRFFKLVAKFPKAKFSKQSLKTIVENLDLVEKLSPKRLRREMANIRKSKNAKKTIKLMKAIGLLDIINSQINIR